VVKVLFHVFAGPVPFGLGHHVRCSALAQEGLSRGWTILWHGNREPITGVTWLRTGLNRVRSQKRFEQILEHKPDWVVIDLPFDAPKTFFTYTQAKWIRTLAIDRDVDADLVISQGLNKLRDGYGAPDYLLLRPEVAQVKAELPRIGKSDCWFVWGGSLDDMGLLQRFTDAHRYRDGGKHTYAVMPVIDGMTPVPQNRDPDHWAVKMDDPLTLYRRMAQCDRAVTVFGMTAWELLAFGVKTWVLPRREQMGDAKLMYRRGLVQLRRNSGVPRQSETLRKFLESPKQWSPPLDGLVDGLGCKRVAELMESKL
jgi:spore coat polysaccharide biosynthesis predicted glycosyltransferase SpsG